MLLRSGGRSTLFAASAALLAFVGPTKAGEVQRIPSRDDWQAIDHCAAYGPDFTSVAGSDACVRIGGRVRVEFGFRKTPDPYDNDVLQVGSHPAVVRSGSSVESPTAIPEGIEQGHVRLNGLGITDPGDP
jgi:hypothetical protein